MAAPTAHRGFTLSRGAAHLDIEAEAWCDGLLTAAQLPDTMLPRWTTSGLGWRRLADGKFVCTDPG